MRLLRVLGRAGVGRAAGGSPASWTQQRLHAGARASSRLHVAALPTRVAGVESCDHVSNLARAAADSMLPPLLPRLLFLVASPQGLNLMRDLYSITTINTINEALCEHHYMHCLPHEEMDRECAKVGRQGALHACGRGCNGGRRVPNTSGGYRPISCATASCGKEGPRHCTAPASSTLAIMNASLGGTRRPVPGCHPPGVAGVCGSSPAAFPLLLLPRSMLTHCDRPTSASAAAGAPDRRAGCAGPGLSRAPGSGRMR